MNRIKNDESICDVIDLFRKFEMNDLDAAEYYLKRKKIKRIQRDSCNHIAIFYPSLGQGGVQKVISILTSIYVDQGYYVVLITEEERKETDYEFPEGIKHYIVDKERTIQNRHDYILRAEQFKKIFVKEKIDILCYHCAWSQLLFYDFLVANLCNVYFVLCKHQTFSHELIKGENYYFRQKIIFKLMDKMVVLSHWEELCWNRLGVNAQYIPNPCDMKLDCNRKKDADYIVWVGRLDLCQKRFLDVIPIMKQVVKKIPDCKLKMFGSGNPIDVQWLQNEIICNGLKDNIIYCGYTTDTDEIYSGARIQLSTAPCEAFPMNVFEGKRYGIPLVIYKLPYLELLKEQKGYLFAEQGDVLQAAKCIIEILTNEKLEKKLQREAKDSVKEYSNDDVAKKWNELFNNLSEDLEPMGSFNFEMLLDIIYGNYDYCRKEMKNAFYFIWKKYVVATVSYRMLEQNAGVAIYPYGKMGKIIKGILNENGIYERYLVDNFLCKEDKEIVSLEHIGENLTENLLFIVCSSSKNNYYEIREQLYKIVPKEKVLDLFPEEQMFRNEFLMMRGML